MELHRSTCVNENHERLWRSARANDVNRHRISDTNIVLWKTRSTMMSVEINVDNDACGTKWFSTCTVGNAERFWAGALGSSFVQKTRAMGQMLLIGLQPLNDEESHEPGAPRVQPESGFVSAVAELWQRSGC